MIELLEDEEIQMSPAQMTEILNLVNKEEILEMEEKAEKNLSQIKTGPWVAEQDTVKQARQQRQTFSPDRDVDVRPLGAAAMETIFALGQREVTPKAAEQELHKKEQSIRARAGSKSGRT